MSRPTSGATSTELAAQLRECRARLLRLTDDLSNAQFIGPRMDIVNPILWEIGHVGWFHEYWTLRGAHGAAPLIERGDSLWDSSNVAHATRWSLELPERAQTGRYIAQVLATQLERLAKGDPGDEVRYFYDLCVRHEDMHVEALAYMRQTLACPAPPGAVRAKRAGRCEGDVAVPGGRWRLGSLPREGFVFDNEKWAHDVELAPFRIGRAPVTNAEFDAFLVDGGYQQRSLWSDAGWAWRVSTKAERPIYWNEKRDGVRTWRRFHSIEPLAPDAPVAFVNWHEAQAWCRWAKRRLPTEAEWEMAALGDPAGGRRRWPWGDAAPDASRANLDFAHDEAIDVGACAAGDSAFGCRQMVGNVWEWTASDFAAFPGFEADPYRDYSLPWFGTRKVLRGGCWATSARIARAAYRNFFTPERNDVIAGFRTCAP